MNFSEEHRQKLIKSYYRTCQTTRQQINNYFYMTFTNFDCIDGIKSGEIFRRKEKRNTAHVDMKPISVTCGTPRLSL